MKRDAILFNVGRGAQVDSAALIRVIRDGYLAGAGLDVTEEEPLPANSPLWDVPEIIITPHAAGFDDMLWERHNSLYSETLRRHFAGQPPTVYSHRLIFPARSRSTSSRNSITNLVARSLLEMKDSSSC